VVHPIDPEPLIGGFHNDEIEGSFCGSPLVTRSQSSTNLSFSDKSIQIIKSSSADDLSGIDSISQLVPTSQAEEILEKLDYYVSELDRFREEREILAKQEEEVLNKIKKRKQEFKALWGVSPLKINSKRTKFPIRRSKEHETLPSKSFCQLESSKKVRFNSGLNESKNLTPVPSVDSQKNYDKKDDHELSGVESLEQSVSSNQHLASLKSSFSFLQTPLPLKKRIVQDFVDESSGFLRSDQVEPTPVALRKLSDRVKAEFAALYADSSEDTDEMPDEFQGKLYFQ